jgi:hypothetical protein
MHSPALRHVHKLALRNPRYEKRLVTNPRVVLERERVPEAEIRLIEQYAPQNALTFGMVIEAVERALYEFRDDPGLLN